MSGREEGELTENKAANKSRTWDAVIFDLDGVVTETADVHARAWKKMFDDFLETYGRETGDSQPPFDRGADYRRYVDGKPRYDGVADFLAARSISLPRGTPADPPDRQTICGLGNRKNELFQATLRRESATVFRPTVRLVQQLKAAGVATAIVSSSKNCRAVLEVTGLTGLFDARVDGVVSEELGLRGKPHPDIFLAAAQRLGVDPGRAVVVEDAQAGVEAGHAGGFGRVVGLTHSGEVAALRARGADRVVLTAEELEVLLAPDGATTDDLPSALDHLEALGRALRQATPVFFLDYDGTLSPIVSRPEDAVLSSEMREAVRRLAAKAAVAVISGRDLADVKSRVGVAHLYYAGSHGFDVEAPDGTPIENHIGRQALPALDAAEKQLHARLDGLEGAAIERKAFSIAVHTRRVAAARTDEVEAAVDDALKEQRGLRKGHGKKVFELQPDVDWHKGKAVHLVLDALSAGDPAAWLPVYIGDDVTDEDAFETLASKGIGVIVHAGAAKATSARYGLQSPSQVRRFLEQIAGRLDASGQRPEDREASA